MTQPPNGREGQGQRLDRMPPQAVEVEQAVLGAMLIEPRAVGRAIELLEEEVFYHGPHARIFAAMSELYERNEAVDQLTVGEELKRRGQLEPAGGVVYLAELAAGVASAANIEHHARGLSRGLIEASAEISNRAFEGRSGVHELIDWAEQRIFALSERGLTQGFEPIEQVLGETMDQLEKAQEDRSAVSGVDTGFEDLNEITSGFQYGDLILLAARPSVGKSALALCCASRAAMQHGKSVAVFTLEMSKQQVAQRLLSIETGFNLQRLRTGHLGQDDWLHVTRQAGRLAQAQIYVDDTAGISVLEARAKSRRLKREHGVDLVIIDYLQLMGSHESLQSREQEVSRISRGLKAMAKELGVPVLALSQLSRAPEARTDRRPQLSDLRESGSLEQDADVVMFIYRPEIYGLKSNDDGGSLEGQAEIILAKQRNGPTGSVRLMWSKESASFENLAPEYRIDEEREDGYIA